MNAKTAAGLYALRGVEMAHEWTGPVTRGWNVKLDDRSSDLISDYKPAPFFFYIVYLVSTGIRSPVIANVFVAPPSELYTNKHETLNQCWLDIEQPSATLAKP